MALDGIAILRGIQSAVANVRGSGEAPSAPAVEPVEIPQAPADTGARPAPPQADISHQLEKLAQVLRESQSSLSFSVDESTGKTIVRIVRSSTGELVRQIPSEEALAIAASLTPGEPLSTLGIDRWS